MASSSDSEKDSNKSPPKPENPFIKFRQFADQQISSLLQGIIGLPSAFSGKPSENPRWAVFDEDLRRRDELQARQQELKESEARRLGEQAASGREDIPVKKSPDWAAFAQWHESASNTDQGDDGLRDVPLYSPVTKSLFAHLHRPGDGEDVEDVDWNKREGVSTFLGMANPWVLKPYERSSNALKTAQHMIHNDLNASPILRSNYSLLPYVMFSPYSPLRLLESTANSPQYRKPDTFPYVDAFEDLIRTIQPRQKPTVLSQLFGNGLSVHYSDSELVLFDPATRASIYQGWIYHLHQSHLLQEREVLPLPRLGSVPFPVATDAPRELTTDSKLVPKEAQTEQEMYEHFLRWASQSKEKFEAVAADAKATFAKELESGELRDIFRLLDKMLEKESVKELFDSLDPAHDIKKQKQVQRRAEINKSGEDPDKVVSETTTTQRVKQVDGSVRTYVSVWKMFADGRETTTTSSHIEEQERDEDGNLVPMVSMAEEAKARSAKALAEKEAEVKKGSKKGWFWN
jgi:hypothetical protein